MSSAPKDKAENKNPEEPILTTYYCQVRNRADASKITQITVQASNIQDALKNLQKEGFLIVSISDDPPSASSGFSFPWLKKKSGRHHLFGSASESEESKAKSSGGKQGEEGSAAQVVPERIPVPFLGGVGTGDLVSFSVQLSSLLKSGIPLLQSLRVVSKGMPHKYFKAVLLDIIDQVNQGFTFCQSISSHPKVFPSLWCNLIEVGEVSGNLAEVLDEIGRYQEASQRIKGKVMTAFFYPVVLLVLASGAVVFLLITIIPKFEEIFKSMSMKLPAITLVVISASNILRHYSLYVVGVVGFIAFIINRILKTKTGRFLWDSMMMKFPLVGSLILQVSVVRMCRGMGTLLKAGVPILQTLKISAKLADNSVIRETLLDTHQSVETGQGLGTVLENAKVFPVFVTQLINVGEESGELIRFLGLIADYYETKVDTLVGRLSTLIEPLMLVMMGGIIGVIVVSMFLPLAEISTRGA